MQHSVVTVVNALTRGALKQRPKPETREEPREWIVVEGADSLAGGDGGSLPLPHQLGSLGERCKLLQQGAGRSRGRIYFLCTLGLQKITNFVHHIIRHRWA